jgi:hypothetical protein
MKKNKKKKFEGNPSRSDNLVNWSHTRCQLRHTPELVKEIPHQTLSPFLPTATLGDDC